MKDSEYMQEAKNAALESTFRVIRIKEKSNPSDEECAKQDSCLLCEYKYCKRELKDMGYAL